jgi:hypothetical protein
VYTRASQLAPAEAPTCRPSARPPAASRPARRALRRGGRGQRAEEDRRHFLSSMLWATSTSERLARLAVLGLPWPADRQPAWSVRRGDHRRAHGAEARGSLHNARALCEGGAEERSPRSAGQGKVRECSLDSRTGPDASSVTLGGPRWGPAASEVAGPSCPSQDGRTAAGRAARAHRRSRSIDGRFGGTWTLTSIEIVDRGASW